MFTFNSELQIGNKLDLTNVENVLNSIQHEKMFYRCDADFVLVNGGELTKEFMRVLPAAWRNDPSLSIDSRSHMLMPTWWPCIPGWHHDDVERSRADGQPNYENPSYRPQHILALVGADVSPTEFALGESQFPNFELGQKCYGIWSPMVTEKIQSGEFKSFFAPDSTLIHFDDRTWHRGSVANKSGWRWFIRATIGTKRIPKNEIRLQTQVYMPLPEVGW